MSLELELSSWRSEGDCHSGVDGREDIVDATLWKKSRRYCREAASNCVASMPLPSGKALN